MCALSLKGLRLYTPSPKVPFQVRPRKIFRVVHLTKETPMTHRKHSKILAIAAVILASCAAALTHSTTGKAAAGGDDSESRVQKGFASVPVNLNLTGKNRALVGLGSYLVNT